MIGSGYLTEYAPLLGHSSKMQAVREIVESIADTTATVLIRGESGVGKDVVARGIHAASARYDAPFIKVNCAALPAGLLESELFGHEKGAFTGAYRRTIGQFEYAHNATIFLDEIGELPLALQAKLLHVLQDFQFCRVGGREMIRVDARVIASTNRDLEVALRRGDFREDLFYRLNVVEIWVPPLRERREEIPFLAAGFLAKFNAQYQRKKELSPRLLTLLCELPWPGNVRELENVIRRIVVLSNEDHVYEALSAARRDAIRREGPALRDSHAMSGYAVEGLREIARRGAREAERRALAEVLDNVQWNRAEAARVLKVSYKTLLNKISECGLAPQSPRNAV
jgi:two-component system response regulator AtoC